jgi:hypothetical protein
MSKGNQGISSNKLVRPGVKTGTPAKKAGVETAAMTGIARGTHSTDAGDIGLKRLATFDRAVKPPQTPLGNEVSLNSKSAPGQGRTIHATGSQHGLNKNPERAGSARPILSEFGPDVPGRK